MKNQKKKSFPRRVFLWLLAILLAVCIAFGVYVNDYYHADPAAEDALVSDDVVSVTKQNGNWVFAPESPTAGLAARWKTPPMLPSCTTLPRTAFCACW